MKLYKIFFGLIALAFLGTSCERDQYYFDGGLHDPEVHMSTYDYLKSKPLFDTLMLLVDKAGLKNGLNAPGTFFAPTDYSIVNYLGMRQSRGQMKDESYTYTLDSLLNEPSALDSIKIYMITPKVNREQMTLDGEYYPSELGIDMFISLKESYQYDDYNSIPAEYVYYTQVINGLDPDDADEVEDEDRDISTLCQTSGIITTNGILHVLSNSHVFIFSN